MTKNIAHVNKNWSKLFRLTDNNIDAWLRAGGWASRAQFEDNTGVNAEMLLNTYVDTMPVEAEEGIEEIIVAQNGQKIVNVSVVSIVHNRVSFPMLSGIWEDENHVWILSDEYMNAIT